MSNSSEEDAESPPPTSMMAPPAYDTVVDSRSLQVGNRMIVQAWGFANGLLGKAKVLYQTFEQYTNAKSQNAMHQTKRLFFSLHLSHIAINLIDSSCLTCSNAVFARRWSLHVYSENSVCPKIKIKKT